MKAAIMEANHEPMVIDEVHIGEPGDHEVHVKWEATGVCHSDVSIWQGKLPIPPPAILGHEGAGVVVSAGKNDYGLAAGDHVIGSFVPVCGQCFFCKNGQPFVCATALEIMFRRPFTRSDGSDLGVGPGGLATFAEEAVVHESALVKIPEEFAFDQAALVGCGVTTGVGSVLNAAKVKEGSSCAVIGCGGVGQAVIQGCRIAGASEIIAVEPNEAKRKVAEGFGATKTVNPSDEDAVEAVKALTEGRGVDYGFEVVGVPALQRQAYDMTRDGGSVVWVGVPNYTDEVSVPAAGTPLANKSIIGTIYGSAKVREDFVKFLNYTKEGSLDLGSMVSQRVKLADINDTFTAMLEGDVIRSVVVYD
ncbi:MAG: Zn-dependent alcohol dehydrogenase [Deltaproteobacteria bacterium]